MNNEASSRPNLRERQLLQILRCSLQIRQSVLESEVADAMLSNLKEEGIQSITDLEFISRIIFRYTGRRVQPQAPAAAMIGFPLPILEHFCPLFVHIAQMGLILPRWP